MKKLTKVVILLVLFSMILGGIFGFGIAKTYFPSKVIISERKDSCERAGGKYRFFWGSLSGEYIENCATLEKDIKF